MEERENEFRGVPKTRPLCPEDAAWPAPPQPVRPVTPVQPIQPVQTVQPVTPPEAPPAPAKAAKRAGWKGLCLAAGVALLAVLAIGRLLSGGESPESVAVRYAKSEVLDMEEQSSLLVYDLEDYLVQTVCDGDRDALYDNMSERYGEELRSWKDICRAISGELRENLDETYASWEITATVQDAQKLSREEMMTAASSRIDELVYYGLLKAKDVTGGWRVTLLCEMIGDGEVLQSRTAGVYLIRSSGWKVLCVG